MIDLEEFAPYVDGRWNDPRNERSAPRQWELTLGPFEAFDARLNFIFGRDDRVIFKEKQLVEVLDFSPPQALPTRLDNPSPRISLSFPSPQSPLPARPPKRQCPQAAVPAPAGTNPCPSALAPYHPFLASSVLSHASTFLQTPQQF